MPIKNYEKRLEYIKKWQKKNIEKKRNYDKIWYQKHNGKNKKIEYVKKNKFKINKQRNKYLKKRRKKDHKFRLDSNMRTLIYHCLRGKKAGRKWKDLVDYNIETLVAHLEKQFDDKMNWDNYGKYWWIDHIRPRSLFKYKTSEDQDFKNCWALENLQPMEKIENIKKGNKY